jgi:tetratricopeptide (TPR) repeat protein
MFGNLPLALSQAAAYMMTMALDFVEYLHRLYIDIGRFISRPFPPYADGVYSCWKLSVEALMESNPHAIDLLRLCSFLSPEGISYDLLYRGRNGIDWLNDGTTPISLTFLLKMLMYVFCVDKFILDDAIDDLVKYALAKRKSLITSSGKSRSLWIHPLVQIWARESYSKGNSIFLVRELEFLAQLRMEGARRAVCLIGNGLRSQLHDRGSSEWIYERETMVHLRICYDEYIPNYIMRGDDSADKRLAFAVWKLGGLKLFWGEYRLAADLLRKSIGWYEKLLSEDPEVEVDMLLVKQHLSLIYICRDKLDRTPEQIEVLINETALRQKVLLGELDPNTLWSLSLKASWLFHQGYLSESIILFERCMENNQKVLKPGDPINMANIHNLAFAYEGVGENNKALELYEQSLALYQKYRGLNHQDTLIVLGNIADWRTSLGNLKGACECRQLVVQGYEATFGLANSNTLEAITRLRRVYLTMKQFGKALQVTEKFLEGWKILNGEESPESHDMLEEIELRREGFESN